MIETDRLILRNWRTEDVEPYHEMFHDARVMEHLGPPHSLEEVRLSVTEAREKITARSYGFWAVEHQADRKFIGFCGVQSGPPGTPIAKLPEIGWRLSFAYWGRGYAREAAEASLLWAWANLTDERIWAITTRGNGRSWGLMERLGMQREEHLDFDHPSLPDSSPLRRHITYSIARNPHY